MVAGQTGADVERVKEIEKVCPMEFVEMEPGMLRLRNKVDEWIYFMKLILETFIGLSCSLCYKIEWLLYTFDL